MLEDYSTGSYGPHEDGPDIERVRRSVPDEGVSAQMALLAGGFADAVRIRVLTALADGPVCVGCLALALEVSQSSISHQLRLLRSLGIVSSERRGRHIYYSLSWPGAEPLLRELRAAAGGGRWESPASTGDNSEEDV